MSRSSLPPLDDDFSRALLGSADADAPSNAAYAKAASALGLGVGLGVGASLPAPAALAVGAAGAAGIGRWSSAMGAKLLALGVSGALLVGGGALFLRGSPSTKPVAGPGAVPATIGGGGLSPRSAPTSSSEQPVRASSVAPAVVGPALAPPPAGHAPAMVGTTRPLGATATPRRALHASPTHAPRGSSLAEQVQSLDSARVALGSGNPSAALIEIARYRKAWPAGVFLTEASVLEVEALAARGERSLAASRAADFVSAHPDSPQADRLRALITAKKR